MLRQLPMEKNNKKSKFDELLENHDSSQGSCSENDPCGDPNYKMPSISEQAKSFARDMLGQGKRFIKGKEIRVSKDIFDERISTCEDCELGIRTLGKLRCQDCGCFMDVKAWLRSSKCPLNKWRDNESNNRNE